MLSVLSGKLSGESAIDSTISRARRNVVPPLKLSVTARDASMYLFPYAKARRFFVGGSSFADQQVEAKIKTVDGATSQSEPKLSIHESGQIHVDIPTGRIGPESTLPRQEFRGEHLATVVANSMEGPMAHVERQIRLRLIRPTLPRPF
jgi:hypothetical protein